MHSHPGISQNMAERFSRHFKNIGDGMKMTSVSIDDIEDDRKNLALVAFVLVELDRLLARIVEEVIKRNLRARGWNLHEENHSIYIWLEN